MILDLLVRLVKYNNYFIECVFILGRITMKACEKFRNKREREQELMEIQANVVKIEG